jgi:malic enzyme
MHIFPAIGLAVYATRAKRVTDEMFVAAAHAVAEEVIKAELDLGLILSAPVGDTEDGVCTLRSAWRK